MPVTPRTDFLKELRERQRRGALSPTRRLSAGPHTQGLKQTGLDSKQSLSFFLNSNVTTNCSLRSKSKNSRVAVIGGETENRKREERDYFL